MAVLGKDLRLELRTFETVPAMVLFSLATFVIFHFGLNRTTIAGPQVSDREQAAEHEPAERHDRERHVDVEDLLDEALVGVQWGVEEHQRKRHGDRGGGE